VTSLFDNTPVPPLGVELRDYQREAIDALFRWFGENQGNPLIVLPTGAGKSMVLAGFFHAVLEQFPKERLLCLTHVKELVEQNHRAMLRAWPGAPAGVCSAGLKRREYDAPILFAGVQSTWKQAGKIGWVDLVVIDEAHLIGSEASGMYRVLLNDLRSMNGKLKVIGLTATPFRTGEGRLDGKDGMFDGVAYDAQLARLIKEGWLSPLITRGTASKINTDGVHKRAGEFVEKELEASAMAGDLVSRAVDELVARAADRRSWLVFCCSIKHATAVAELLSKRHRIACATVFGSTPVGERDEIVRAFRAGEIRCVVNVNVLTTGFDAPMVDVVALLRPTCSPVLYVQMVGRGLRRAEGKTDCLILDFGGNMQRHGPIDEVQARPKGEGEGIMARECPQCLLLVAFSLQVCPECGFEWAVVAGESPPKHEEKPDEQGVIVAGLHPTGGFETRAVTRINYRAHTKPGRPTSMCVEFETGFRSWVRTWVCFEHAGYPRKKAEQWWREHMATGSPVPDTVDVALTLIEIFRANHQMREATHVVVDVRKEFPELKREMLGHLDAGESEYEPPAAPGSSTEQVPF